MKKLFVLALTLSLLFSVSLLSAQTEPDQKTMAKITATMEKVNKAMEKKDGEKAMKLIEEILKLKADYSPALYQKARFFYGKDPAQAIALLEQAVKADPSNAQAVKDLAAMHYQNAGKVPQGDLAAAAEEYRKASDVPNLQTVEKGLYVECLFNAGALNYQQGKIDAAVPFFEKLTAIADPTSDNQKKSIRLAHYMLGMAHYQAKRMVPAQDSLKNYIVLSEAIADDAYLPIARFILADLLMNDLNAQALKINQDQKEEKTSRIAALAATRPEVVDYLQKAMAAKPDIAETAHMHLGNYFYLSGNADKAIEEYENLIRDFSASEQLPVYQNFLKEMKAEKEKQAQAAKKPAAKKK